MPFLRMSFQEISDLLLRDAIIVIRDKPPFNKRLFFAGGRESVMHGQKKRRRAHDGRVRLARTHRARSRLVVKALEVIATLTAGAVRAP